MDNFTEIAGYTFKKPELLETALSHSSYANEKKGGRKSNERLEFLGDSVLQLTVSEYIYKHYAKLPEGDMTKLRAGVVCESALCEYAKELELGKILLLGKGEAAGGGASRPSILSDAFEAVIAAIYLDGGFLQAKKFILRFVEPKLKANRTVLFEDYKTILQEIVQQNPDEKLNYRLVEEKGPDHDKSFIVELLLNSNVIGKGQGRSKKQAEQNAAKDAMELLGY